MLNISPNSIKQHVDQSAFPTLDKVEKKKSGAVLRKLIVVSFIIGCVALLIPWTQTIQARGYITTLKPDQRPQSVNALIDGQVDQWFVKEGDSVKKGDTLLILSEIKADYLDPGLIDRTASQLNAAKQKVFAYDNKVEALKSQVTALKENLTLKSEQARNKIRQAELKMASDSIKLEAASLDLQINNKQLERMEQLHKDGLKSLRDLEAAQLKARKAKADKVAAENQLLTSNNELINARITFNTLSAEYRDKIAKAESEKFSALSNRYESDASVAKLQNQLSNYELRAGMYHITAPQNGYIMKTTQSGLGEAVKEGEELLRIVPGQSQLSVTMYVEPIDLPLVAVGQNVRIQFDGWPAVVFSGWPGLSTGLSSGKIFAIDNFISENGKYRVLIAPDADGIAWPNAVRIGGGAKTMLLLKDVPVWYELWRRVNGFPADYYKPTTTSTTNISESKSKK